MPVFGTRSKNRLKGVASSLVVVMEDAIEVIDFAIICGHRTEQQQNNAYEMGLSKVQWPNSKHNPYPSLAVDFAPWPINWNDHLAFARVWGVIEACAYRRGVKLRWGGDWDRDGSSRDQSFMDIGHVELVR